MSRSVAFDAALNDADIREKLDIWLAHEFFHDQSTVVYHEFVVPRPSARVDVAVVNGRLSGFEIKSDRDSLVRLPQQIRSYNAVFERVTLVTTATHIARAKKYIPDWWGILVAHHSAPLSRIRASRINRDLEIEKALHLLTVNELMLLAKWRDCDCRSRHRKIELIEILCKLISKAKLISDVRQVLKSRITQVDRQNHHSSADI